MCIRTFENKCMPEMLLLIILYSDREEHFQAILNNEYD
jgi:hypothetical protein